MKIFNKGFRFGQLLHSLLVYLIILSPLKGQEEAIVNYTPSDVNIEASMILGVGLDDIIVGKTSDNDDITISGGGGIGIDVTFNYLISDAVSAGAGFGYQVSSLMPEVENAEGDFDRTRVFATVAYRYPISENSWLNLGGGPDMFFPGSLDLDMSDVEGGAHNIYAYKSTMGFHLQAEYEGWLTEKWRWAAGLRFIQAEYEMESVTSNGITVPADNIPSEIRNEIETLSGSAVNLYITFRYDL